MKTRVEKIEDFLKSIYVENLDLMNCVDAEEVESFDDIYEAIDNSRGFEVEMMYYAVAMRYLTEYDTSLKQSLEIASELGYDMLNLSSEVLASLLASQKCREDFESKRDDIDDFFSELEDDEDENE
jgi:hypothetical protein